MLGIDPGTQKCGFAVVRTPGAPPVELGIVATPALGARVVELLAAHSPRAIALGGGTHRLAVLSQLEATGIPIHFVDERDTTLLARARYFLAHPPTGWRRLVPRGMLMPPRPIDDFAAVLIAERFLAREVTGVGEG